MAFQHEHMIGCLQLPILLRLNLCKLLDFAAIGTVLASIRRVA